MANDQRRDWDRSADLQAIEAAYHEYDQAGRYRIWDPSAPGYARLVESVQGSLIEQLARAVRGRDTTVLDLGCGTGSLRGVATDAGIRATWIGLDLRADAIEVASQDYPDDTFLVGSADAVPLADGSVDVVVAKLLFSSLPSAEMEHAVALEIRRLLRPGGSLMWLDIRYSNPANTSVHGVTRQRLKHLFPGWRVDVRSAGLLPPLARRLGRSTPVIYPILQAIPPLRSHLVGRLQPGAA